MANAKEIFNNKFIAAKLTGSTNFFNNLEEIKEFNNLQEKYISNVDYSEPKNFARFGSAVEYYKNAYNYISTNYPYDGSTAEKLNWVNSLNELEYYIYSKQIIKYKGYANLQNNKYIKVNSHIQEITSDTADVYELNRKNLYNKIDFSKGLTFEAWMNFEDDASDTNILTIQAINGSGGSFNLNDIINIKRVVSPTPHFVIIDSLSSTVHSLNAVIDNLKWHHYAFTIYDTRILFFVDGILAEEIKNIDLTAADDTYIFGPFGLMHQSLASTNPSTTSLTEQHVFTIGGGQKFSVDEVRFWNNERNLERIGRYWFTHIDGNDFSDYSNSNLLFYYKFNEGWDQQYLQICLDYSGRKNDGVILNYDSTCRSEGSGLDLSGIVQDVEEKDIIYNGMEYSTALKVSYGFYMLFAEEHDVNNRNMLYNKFPGWILEEETDNESQHLKQLIQIVSSYFDDLYNKIKEMTNYKNINYSTDKSNIYPFYDKILTSTGFDVTDLFANLNIIEKVSSRNDQTLFDEDIKKIKNGIFQNIYNNISYIFKSKGTGKSIKSFLRSYGVDENLIKINLYADRSQYDVKDRSNQTVVKKKTITMKDENRIYLNSVNAYQETAAEHYYTLEIAVSFPKKLKNTAPAVISLFGYHNSAASVDYDPTTANYQYYCYIENDPILGSRFAVTNGTSVQYSDYYKDLFDDTVWNICFRKTPAVDTLIGADNPGYTVEFYAVNKNCAIKKEKIITFSHTPHVGYIRHYIGARNIPYDSNNNIYVAHSKFFYCNFWTDYLNNNIIGSHNLDILNYGVDE